MIKGTVSVVPSDIKGTVSVVPSDIKGTVSVVSSDIKGTVSVVPSDPPWKEGNIRFLTVPEKALFDKV